MTQDPAEWPDGLNRQEYTGSNPVAFKDPLGLEPTFDPKDEELRRIAEEASKKSHDKDGRKREVYFRILRNQKTGLYAILLEFGEWGEAKVTHGDPAVGVHPDFEFVGTAHTHPLHLKAATVTINSIRVQKTRRTRKRLRSPVL